MDAENPMPTFLSDPSFTLYVALILGVFVTGGLLVRKQDRGSLIRASVAALLLLLLFLCDRFYESPREEAVRRVQTMGQAVNDRNWDGLFAQISDKFQYDKYDKKSFRDLVVLRAQQHTATVAFKNFDRNNFVELPDGQLQIGFDALIFTPSAVERIPLYIEATFKKEADGQYRLQGFTVYDFINRSSGGIQKLPGS